MSAQKTAYPLTWPAGQNRVPLSKRIRSRFGRGDTKPTTHYATSEVVHELNLFGARNVVISTNVELRNDGLPRSNRRDPEDAGVAVYFTKNQQELVLACDTFDKVGCNLYAVSRTINAFRQMERDGCSEMLNRAFTGFRALGTGEKPAKRDWTEVLGVQMSDGYDRIKARHRELSKRYHPDNLESGDANEFRAVQAAWSHYDTLCCNGG